MPSLMAVTHKTPGTWAVKIKTSHNTNISLVNATNISSLSDDAMQGLRTNTVLCISTFLVMVAIMMICHYMMKRHIVSKFDKIASLMGLIWKNRDAQHNPGECKFIAYFLIQIKTAFPVRQSTVEVPIQICTLPLTVTDWYLKEPVRHEQWATGQLKSYSSRHLVFSLNWTPDSVCVRSKLSSNLETCGDMPRSVRVARWYVDQDSNLPWWAIGKTYSVISVSRIVLERHGVYADLYHYRL